MANVIHTVALAMLASNIIIQNTLPFPLWVTRSHRSTDHSWYIRPEPWSDHQNLPEGLRRGKNSDDAEEDICIYEDMVNIRPRSESIRDTQAPWGTAVNSNNVLHLPHLRNYIGFSKQYRSPTPTEKVQTTTRNNFNFIYHFKGRLLLSAFRISVSMY